MASNSLICKEICLSGRSGTNGLIMYEAAGEVSIEGHVRSVWDLWFFYKQNIDDICHKQCTHENDVQYKLYSI